MAELEPAEQPAKRGRGRPRKLPPPGDRHTVRLTVTTEELEQLRRAIEVLRQAGETGLSQVDFTRRAVLAEAGRVLGATKAKPGRKR
jgi:hypothetical protein